jgi:23S rRNA U2552 (ribose-2'-O)-methylase RlmE/FtsJ
VCSSDLDEENIFELNLLTLETASSYLKKDDGYFIMKTFQNSSLKKLRLTMEKSFQLVQTYKPAASKSKSGEIYLYGAKPL